ncbi:hypothetical protein CIW52_26715 [Mycolicibacterium sp. P9-64]|uniref:DUF3566 domain-containing protein n=1 Tax=Mycolicibacterium sp. P9-64 TaxID=2024612 RepID=UPI0011EC3CCE|nr:DUF3566 domain-containing protein [Mycolicibacterium sp. P9-64]KAA0079736.1 hypothetical protein CIW52_26715 [Mycolicibacterium sp. P9-64]
MSSPNEPGHPRAGDGPGSANGSTGGDHGDVPPWQRGTSRVRPTSRPPESAPEAGRAGSAAGQNPGVDARLNRFISGGPAAPAGPPQQAPAREPSAPREQDPAPARGDRTETVRPEVYASELPDLSGPTPRGPQRKPADRQEQPAARPQGASRTQVASRPQGPVRASMQIRRLDPWSVLKVSLVLSVALFFVWMIAVAFLYLVLGGMGVWSKLNSNVGDLLTSASGSGGELVSSGTIFGGAALIGLVNIVLLTAMATCGAFIYNLTTDIVGGVEVTLADRD